MKTSVNFGAFPIVKKMTGFYMDLCGHTHFSCLLEDAISGMEYTGTIDVWVIGWGHKYWLLCLSTKHRLEKVYTERSKKCPKRGKQA